MATLGNNNCQNEQLACRRVERGPSSGELCLIDKQAPIALRQLRLSHLVILHFFLSLVFVGRQRNQLIGYLWI